MKVIWEEKSRNLNPKSLRHRSHPKTLPETNPDSVTMRTLQPPLSWQLYMHLSSAASDFASDVETASVLNSFPLVENALQIFIQIKFRIIYGLISAETILENCVSCQDT